jgi:hypothetical protein
MISPNHPDCMDSAMAALDAADTVARLADPHAKSTARLWASIAADKARGPRVPVVRNADGDTAELASTRRPRIGYRETAKPGNCRQAPAVGLWTWTLAWAGAGLVAGGLLYDLAIRLCR